MTLLFSIARLPRIEFGAGTLSKLPTGYRGHHVLFVTGAHSFVNTSRW